MLVRVLCLYYTVHLLCSHILVHTIQSCNLKCQRQHWLVLWVPLTHHTVLYGMLAYCHIHCWLKLHTLTQCRLISPDLNSYTLIHVIDVKVISVTLKYARKTNYGHSCFKFNNNVFNNKIFYLV